MIKNLISKTAKTLLVPALIATGLTACGTNNNGTKTNSLGTNSYNGYNYNTTGYGNGYGINRYGFNTNNYGYGTNNYGYGTNTYGVNNYNGPGYGDNNLTGYRNYDRTATYGTNNNRINQQIATRVATAADNVPGVSKATALVQGNNIVVGFDVATNKTHAEYRNLEQQVLTKIKNLEPGYTVHVTSDKNLHSRIQAVYRSLNTNTTNNYNNYRTNTNPINPGHPVRDLGADIGNIIRDIGRSATAPFR